MIYLAMQIVIRQVNQPVDKNLESIALVKMSMNNAFFNSTEIKFSEEKKILSCLDTGKIYQFMFLPGEISMLISTESPRDIIFQGNYDSQITGEVDDLVTEISLSFPIQGDTLHLWIDKAYSSSTKLNHKKS